MGTYPAWLETSDDLRYTGSGALTFDLEPNELTFDMVLNSLDFDMSMSGLEFDLIYQETTFAPVHVPQEWQGNTSAIVFTLTRVEII